MMKWPDLVCLAGSLAICLTVCNVAAAQTAQTEDPCRLVVNLATGRPESPNSTLLESALLNDARSRQDYMSADVDWIRAANQLSAAESKVLATEAGTRRLDAESRYRTTVASFLGTPAGKETYTELLAVCEEIQKVRIQLLANNGEVAREIASVQQEAKALRARAVLGSDAFLARYNADTDSLVAASVNTQAMQKLVAERLAVAKASRNRLKAAADGKQ